MFTSVTNELSQTTTLDVFDILPSMAELELMKHKIMPVNAVQT